MNPTARSFQPSKSHATSPPASSRLNPSTTSFAPTVALSKTTPGWPPQQSPLTDKRWNDTHPSEIPDSVFLSDHASWLHLENPFEGNHFEPSLIPWWTHWVVVFANKKTNLDDSAIAKLYKHRYRDVIPGIQNMVTADALQLYEYLCDSAHTYASEYVPFSEVARRSVSGFWKLLISKEGRLTLQSE